MATCPACNAEVPDGSRFCSQCGHEVTIGSEADEQDIATGEADNERTQTLPKVDEVATELPPDTAGAEQGRRKRIIGAAIVAAVVVILVGGAVFFGVFRHNALVRSEAAYSKAQTDIANANLKSALSDLQDVVPYDPNYSKAQDQINSVKQAQDIVTLANNVLRDSAKYDSDVSTFWQHYDTVVGITNKAWDDYSPYLFSSNSQQDLNGVDANLATLTSSVSNISSDVSDISADFGEVASSSALAGFNTSTLLDSYRDSSDQANIISTTLGNESSSLQSGTFVDTSVPQDISTTNAAFSALQTDQLKSDQGAAQFLGFAMGIVDKLLGQPITLHNINNSEGNPQTSQSSSVAPTSSNDSLTTFNDSNNGITVDVPSQWSKALITGGDYSGWRFVNPNDPNEEEILVASSDVGGYTNSDGSLNTSNVIPETNVSGTFIFNHGLSVGYTFYKAGNPYEGNGVVTVSNDKNGYGYVEILLPESEKALATQILNSFKLTL